MYISLDAVLSVGCPIYWFLFGVYIEVDLLGYTACCVQL